MAPSATAPSLVLAIAFAHSLRGLNGISLTNEFIGTRWL
jgi:hypothetical protein